MVQEERRARLHAWRGGNLLTGGEVGGLALRLGHYTCYVKSPGGEWFHCDDAAPPLLVDEAQVLRASAYLLFYQRS